MTACVDRSLETANRIGDEMTVLLELATLTRQVTRFQASFWFTARQCIRESNGLSVDVRLLAKLCAHCEIDPNDALCGRLLVIQQRARQLISAQQAIASALPREMFIHRLLAWSTEKTLRRFHAEMGLVRDFILEHDADCSPVINESFTSADALIAALQPQRPA